MELSILTVNPTELIVLRTLSSYKSVDVPQSIFKSVGSSTIKKALKSLTDKGLICKKFNTRDMRQRYVRLTEDGIEVMTNERNIN